MAGAPRLRAFPLAAWERDGLKAALLKSGLPIDSIDSPNRLFWRFESTNDVPVGFGGLDVHGEDALLHSVVTLPPLRDIGMGSGIVTGLEIEARAFNCRALYLLTTSEADFFAKLDYITCPRTRVPEAIRTSAPFISLAHPGAIAMLKRID